MISFSPALPVFAISISDFMGSIPLRSSSEISNKNSLYSSSNFLSLILSMNELTENGTIAISIASIMMWSMYFITHGMIGSLLVASPVTFPTLFR